MMKERTKGQQLGGRLVRNICYNSERKKYGYSLEKARQKKKVRPMNEVVDFGRTRMQWMMVFSRKSGSSKLF